MPQDLCTTCIDKEIEMTIRATAAAVLVLTAITWAQRESRPAANPMAGSSRRVVATSNAAGVAENARAQNSARQRMEEMGSTLAKMHALLKQMQAKNSASASKDPAAKANLEMWGLMVADLDKQYEQLRAATLAREDMEARREADEKAAAAARNAQQNLFPAKVGPAVTGQSSAPAAAGTTPAATPGTAPPSTSPN
jgi:L-lactate utilization protein LutC